MINMISIQPNAVFVSHKIIHNAGAGFSAAPSIRYHSYLIKNVHPLKYSVAFANCWSFKEGDTSSSFSEEQYSGDEQGSGGSARQGMSVQWQDDRRKKRSIRRGIAERGGR